ncbi:hypothetical protein EVAR_29694_1 [Eumeta japonica]|uniref:Uncharacterized protein n=1 Tax=Eumeta variegata TaxID=151549 RepID=A0A4C1VY48_EUMVA|nr:hypothetical protein EVAR_29694_1 [Eumeta japonica]
MDSKRVTRARKMNTAEQENEMLMSALTSRSSETGTLSTHTWDHDTRSDRVDAPNAAGPSDTTYGPLAANMRNRSPTHKVNIDNRNRNVNTAQQKKRAMLLAQLEFERLKSERKAAHSCDNASHLSETDKLEKQTVGLADIEPAP